jgi:hypothetical protein
LKENNGRISSNKSTDNSRVILALTSLGIKATDFLGYDLTAALADLDWVKKQGVNGTAYALIALDSAKYDIPQLPAGSTATQTTRENLLTTLTDAQITGGGWALTGTTADADITGMVLQALAAYYGTGNEAIDKAVDAAKTVLSDLQHTTKAGFGSPLAEGVSAADADVSTLGAVSALAADPKITAESTAQVLMALDALGVSVYHPDFVKNDVTTFDALHLFAIRDNSNNVTGFSHYDGELTFNYMATELGMLALVSHSLALNGQRLFDMTAVPLAAYVAPESASPATADAAQMQLYLALVGVSLIIMSGAVLMARRQRKLER